MSRTTFAIVLVALALSGCLPMPPTSQESGGGASNFPCGWKAVDAGMCPYVGYRKPIYR
jgi:hypothetical protein